MFTCKHPIGKEPEPQEMPTSDRSRITNLMWGRHAHRWRFSRLGGSIFRVVLLGLVVVVGVYAAEDQDPEPAVIRIGHQKQLFVDNFLLDTGFRFHSLENVSRVLHYPARYKDNPILAGTEPWENWLIGPDGRPVLYDEETREFKMWYSAYRFEDDKRLVYRVCYATSTDGIHWIRPDLGLVEWQGSRHNNLLNGGQHWMRRPNVIIDTRDTDPKRRFKMTYVDLIDGKEALVKAFSPDGIHWDLNADHNPLFVRNHNANLLGWDERIAQYVLYRRTWGFQQPIVRSTSTDFSNWSSPEVVLAPGPMELNKDFKGLAAFKCGDLYLALLWVFERAPDVDYTADAELVFSRDGIQWQRVTPGELYLKRGEPGSWDSAGIIPCAPVIHDNKVWIYYSGWNAPYTNEAEERQQKGWIENGQRKQTAIGLAVLRLDGFASLHASSSGTVTTRRLELPDGSLAVNADVRGELRVEILDESGRVISGYGAADCEPIRSDRVHHQVQWHANAGLGPLRGKVVRLRFVLRDADLYSFCFEPGT